MENVHVNEPVYVPPSAPSRCTWHRGISNEKSPHTKESPSVGEKPRILPTIIDAIGQTPLVRINKIAAESGVQCQLLAKCEFMNPGGSLKDRIAPRMVNDAERAGLIKPGCTLIAPTSGNTGIGVAMLAAVRGYRCIIVMPQKMSKEKALTMKALGAEIYRTPNSAGYMSLESPFAVAQKLQREIPNSFILDQYASASNPLAHYDVTAEEILEQCDGDLDMMIIGTGTGGALTGIGRKLKEKCPKCQIVAVDPVGSIMAHPDDLSTKKFFEVEGIGHDFVPTVCDSGIVDHWFKAEDKDTMIMARRLVREEGLLCGGSSGSNMVAAVNLAKGLEPNQKCVVLLPDGIRNYMTKFLDDQWMEERGFVENNESLANQQWWAEVPVLKLIAGPAETITPSTTCQEALLTMKTRGLNGLPVLDDGGSIKGIVTQETALNGLLSGENTMKNLVADFINTQFRKVPSDTPLITVARILRNEPFVIVTTNGTQDKTETYLGTVSKMDFFHFLSDKDPMWTWSPRWTC